MADCGVPINSAAMQAAMVAAGAHPADVAQAMAEGAAASAAAQHHAHDQWAHDFIVNQHMMHGPQMAAQEAQLAAAFEEAMAVEAAQQAHQQAAWDAEFAAQQRDAAAAECPCDWADQLHAAMEETGETWAEQFNDATNGTTKTFTVEGEPLLTVEEKNAASGFFGLMEKLKTGEVVIEEPDKPVQVRPDGVVDGGLSADFLTEMAAAAGPVEGSTAAELGLNDEEADDEAMENAWGGGALGDDPEKWMEEYKRRVEEEGEDAEHFQQGFHDGDADSWLNEYKEMNARMAAAQESSEYPFEQNNPFLFHDNLMAEAQELIGAGTLSEGILALEALCQKEPENLEAWYLLGTKQAENEKDAFAIRALNMCRKLQPARLDVYQALAVSHTNEANFTQAMQAMRAWITNHPQYRSLETALAGRMAGGARLSGDDQDEEGAGSMAMEFLAISPTEHRQVCTLYEAAMEMNPADLDLVVGLGVLRHLAHQYDEAAAMFRRAVELRPEDAKLWNKLGATLANGDRSREAIEAYQRALDINPGFVRVRYNLGIAFTNLGEHRMAATQFLRAIAMQQGSLVGGGNNDGNGVAHRSTKEIWDTLRMTFNVLERADLVELSWKMNVRDFETEFGLEGLI